MPDKSDFLLDPEGTSHQRGSAFSCGGSLPCRWNALTKVNQTSTRKGLQACLCAP